jgi:hypothetical protein
MTIYNSGDIDKAMGKYIAPRDVPVHNGADEAQLGAFRGERDGNSDHVTGHQQTDFKGSAVFNNTDLPSNERFGSTTVISINEAPPLEAKLDPKVQAQARAQARAVPVARPQAPAPPPKVHQPTPPRTTHALLNRIPVKGTQPPPPPKPVAPPPPAPVAQVVNGQVVAPHTPQPIVPAAPQGVPAAFPGAKQTGAPMAILRPKLPPQPLKPAAAPAPTPAQQLAAGKSLTMAQLLARRK